MFWLPVSIHIRIDIHTELQSSLQIRYPDKHVVSPTCTQTHAHIHTHTHTQSHELAQSDEHVWTMHRGACAHCGAASLVTLIHGHSFLLCCLVLERLVQSCLIPYQGDLPVHPQKGETSMDLALCCSWLRTHITSCAVLVDTKAGTMPLCTT